jgi:hypothetical protein
VEDGREHATYDIENGRMTVYLPKEEKGTKRTTTK